MKRSIILAIFFLCAPARAEKADIVIHKTAPCSNVPAIALAAPEPDVVFVAVPFAVNIFKAIKPRCKMPGRVWHEGKCYKKERLP